MEIVRDAPFRQLVRFIFRYKFFLYPEEHPGFECPHTAYNANSRLKSRAEPFLSNAAAAINVAGFQGQEKDDLALNYQDTTLSLIQYQTLAFTAERLEEEEKLALNKTLSIVLSLAKNSDGTILKKKAFIAFHIKQIIEHFGVSEFNASLGLALYIIGCYIRWSRSFTIGSDKRNSNFRSEYTLYGHICHLSNLCYLRIIFLVSWSCVFYKDSLVFPILQMAERPYKI
ncbi:MFS general substrate transporter [Penicillium odoratum]|uniref:MFS general substrate transporter n=1 Tax=Penicillium odoratum TaxID=1167516 RepID=UPI0025490DAF|nr:MFS general substrate transporter [Penicillium odoratum]KAJ5745082.1 MFS general substrate transporter [Penicillium odoratum]